MEAIIGGGCIFSEKYLYLTPRMFERFDLICRVYAGRPMDVFDLEEARSTWLPNYNWAEAGGMTSPLYSASKNHIVAQKGIISIANKIPLEEIQNSDRLEFVVGEDIPLDIFYEWLVWHEIEHIRKGDHLISFKLQLDEMPEVKSKGVKDRLLMLMELQADSAAYQVFYPNGGLCRRFNNQALKAKIEKIESHSKLLERLRKKYLSGYEIKPCPVTPGEFIPDYQRKHGIPWSKAVAQFMN